MTNQFQVKAYETLFQESEDEWRKAMRVENLLKAQIAVLQDELTLAAKNTARHEGTMKRAAQWLLDNNPAMQGRSVNPNEHGN